jgi:hypothetical protein
LGTIDIYIYDSNNKYNYSFRLTEKNNTLNYFNYFNNFKCYFLLNSTLQCFWEYNEVYSGYSYKKETKLPRFREYDLMQDIKEDIFYYKFSAFLSETYYFYYQINYKSPYKSPKKNNDSFIDIFIYIGIGFSVCVGLIFLILIFLFLVIFVIFMILLILLVFFLYKKPKNYNKVNEELLDNCTKCDQKKI